MNLPPLRLSGGSVGGNGWWSGGGGSVQGNYTTAVQARVWPLTVVIVTPPRKNKAGRSERRTVEQSVCGRWKRKPPNSCSPHRVRRKWPVRLPPSLSFLSVHPSPCLASSERIKPTPPPGILDLPSFQIGAEIDVQDQAEGCWWVGGGLRGLDLAMGRSGLDPPGSPGKRSLVHRLHLVSSSLAGL